MASEITYTFFQYHPTIKGLLNCANIGKKIIYNGSQKTIACYSFNTGRTDLIAIFRFKSWKQKL